MPATARKRTWPIWTGAGSWTLEEGRLLGWLIGDGHIRPDKGVMLNFYGEEKRELAPVFARYMNAAVGPKGNDRYQISPVEVAGRDQATVSSVRFARTAAERYHLSTENKLAGVPPRILGASEELQRGFLQALFTADGHVSGTPGSGVVEPVVLRFFLRTVKLTPGGHYLVSCQDEHNWFDAHDTSVCCSAPHVTVQAGHLSTVELLHRRLPGAAGFRRCRGTSGFPPDILPARLAQGTLVLQQPG